jgi:hypothetical protein
MVRGAAPFSMLDWLGMPSHGPPRPASPRTDAPDASPTDGPELFEFVCGELERRGQLSRAVARGTVRLAMKQALLNEDRLTRHGMSFVVRRILPGMLERRKIGHAEALCRMIAKVLEVSPAEDLHDRPSSLPEAGSCPPSGWRPVD